jgi:hypothetical protein
MKQYTHIIRLGNRSLHRSQDYNMHTAYTATTILMNRPQ